LLIGESEAKEAGQASSVTEIEGTAIGVRKPALVVYEIVPLIALKTLIFIVSLAVYVNASYRKTYASTDYHTIITAEAAIRI
jgi:hypothetical protein